MALYLKANNGAIRIRESISISSKSNILAVCPVGESVEILEFIPGIQDNGGGYQWVKTRYGEYTGYSQLDTTPLSANAKNNSFIYES